MTSLPSSSEVNQLKALERKLAVQEKIADATRRYAKIIEQTGGELPEVASDELKYVHGYMRCMYKKYQLERDGLWDAYLRNVQRKMSNPW